MFVEPRIDSFKADRKGAGWIEVICGSMFSGKTEELIRRLNRAKIAKQKIEIFKPAVDTRYHETSVVSHDESSIRSTPVQFADDILLLAGNSDVVGIDEAQFFDLELIHVARTLANQGKRVILAGLDMDFKGEPFGPMPSLMGIAEFVTKVHAICMKCGGVASYSYRLTASDKKVLLGEHDAYEARCRNCFYQDFKDEPKS
ncbi:thymidine kinase [Reichenbachiella faecimaris]|uniref:Thymidine kinase n=1 Tax=Reichenbachiella faecimaris TaxID=692418 RepID=A0A1W2GGA6_REIFA|nr:thymidine kinase [Reichenbachiella faecimaris]SMD35316.1 thymidine kinase [Reichenbachiella faecimaris]